MSGEDHPQEVEVTVLRGVRDRRLTENEWAWVEFLRLSSEGAVPAPTLASVQMLRRMLPSIASRDRS